MSERKTLVIVESPAKARTLHRYLGQGYIVRASKGHVKDLPKNRLGVDIERGFVPEWVNVKGRERILNELKQIARDVDRIILATDPDREGEAISYHIAEELKDVGKPMVRVWLREITRRGIEQALREPRDLNLHLVEAQFTRRILDRLVGYRISPLLWAKIWRGLSAGRVQSVALRLIVEREREIESFEPQEYWVIQADLLPEGRTPFRARLVRQNGKKCTIPDETTARAIESALRTSTFVVERVERKRRRRPPAPPLITARLQQEAATRWRWSAQKTMQVAQRLYEGVDLPEGRTGLITYMRTDSTRVAPEAVRAVRAWIREHFGEEMLPRQPRQYPTSGSAQDAHEAIRPTDIRRTPDQLKNILPPDEWRLYDLVWRKFVASQMKDAQYDVTTIVVRAGPYELEARGEILVDPGFMHVEPAARRARDGDEERTPTRLPDVHAGERLALRELLVEQKWTQPPPRYTEATLIRELEKRGIGRPSTYATIVSIIQNRDYVVKERNTFRPTALGRLVCTLLEQFFPDMMDYAYTARMEERLDEVEQGRADRQTILRNFYRALLAQLQRAEAEMPAYKGGAPIGRTCSICNEGELILRWSRNGGFVYCSRQDAGCPFKEDYERWLARETAHAGGDTGNTGDGDVSALSDVRCPRCGQPMQQVVWRQGRELVCTECRIQALDHPHWPPIRTDRSCPNGHTVLVLRNGRYGLFYACAEPDCRGTTPVYTGLPCLADDCPGEMVLLTARRGRRLREFYGCDRYRLSRCTFTFEGVPESDPCPECGAPYRVRRRKSLVCVRPTCATAVARSTRRRTRGRRAQ